jgi:pimeloyl-ACP methyl ester carboxylesterase
MKFTDTFLKRALAMLIVLALGTGCVSNDQTTKGETNMDTKEIQGQYVNVNGLKMYYEIHGEGQPLVLLHGAFSAIGTSFGKLLPELAKSRQVIAFELQGHGHTADIDRPLNYEQMADDTVAALQQLGIEQADFFGYSMGSAVALQVAIRHPEMVRKLVFASVSYKLDGLHPGLMDGLAQMTPDMMVGSPWHEEYKQIAPNLDDFDTLFTKVMQMDQELEDIPDEVIAAIKSPALLIIGDSDIIRPEHAVEMFRLFGGGIMGDTPAGLPNSQLAILPGTSHVTLVDRADLLLPIIPPFLDAPMPEGK